MFSNVSANDTVIHTAFTLLHQFQSHETIQKSSRLRNRCLPAWRALEVAGDAASRGPGVDDVCVVVCTFPR